ncbi:hypothetical protein GWK26_08570 [haloarchaeon 3A1-DGR]|nr:hypothetical protein GWK26_08570 [haloarchaeon 3A1-DGR]
MLTSAVAVAVPASTLATAQPSDAGPPGMVGVPSENVGPPDHSNAPDHAGPSASPNGNGNGNSGGAGPGSKVGPPSNANIPTHAAAWSIHASNHSETLAVEVGETADGDVALVLSDEQHHAGRDIALDAETLEDALGYRPEVVYGEHESGDRWTREIRYSDGYAVFEVPQFSSNLATFSGGIGLSGDEADDGTEYQYELDSLDGLDNYSISVTGADNTAPASTSGTLQDGETLPVDIGGTTDPRNASVTLTGRESTTSDSVSQTAVSDGESVGINVGGTTSPRDETITLTGRESSTRNDQTGTLSGSSSDSIAVDGNLDPVGPDGSGDPVVSVTGSGMVDDTTPWDGTNDDGHLTLEGASGGGTTESRMPNPPEDEPIDALVFHFREEGVYSSGDLTLDIYINSNGLDKSASGTLVKSDYTIDPTQVEQTAQVVELDQPFDASGKSEITVDFQGSGSGSVKLKTDEDVGTMSQFGGSDGWYQHGQAAIEMRTIGDATVSADGQSKTFTNLKNGETRSTTFDLSQSPTIDSSFTGGSSPSLDYDVQKTDRYGTEDPSATIAGQTVSHSGLLAQGETVTESVDLSTGSDSISVSTGHTVDVSSSWTEVSATEDPSATIAGQTVSHTGILGPGETVTESVDLSQGDGPIDVSTSGHTTDVAADWTEVTQTRDPTISVNGYDTGHEGVLTDGETVDLATNTAWIENGTNNVSVSTSSPLSGPSSLVDLTYQHDAESATTSVDVQATTWVENITASNTYPSDQQGATATLAMNDRVVEVRSLETRTNGTSWESVPESNYELNGTDLEVDLGDVSQDTTIEVRAVGGKASVSGGTIDVLEPTVEGDTLDTKIEVVERSEDFTIDVTNTSESERVHYTASESWDASSYAVVKASGEQSIRMPDASNGSTTRVKTAPLEVHPETGSAEVIVYDPTEPSFRVRPGETPGSTVDIGWMDAASEVTYDLRDEDDDPVDTSTANSPVWFTAPLEAATYTIVESPPSEPRVAGPTGQQGSGLVPGWMLLLLGVAGALAVLMLVSRRVGSGGGRGSDGIGRGSLLFLVGAGVIAVIAAELLTADPLPSVLLTSIADATRAASGPLAALALGIALLVGLWQVDVRTQADVPRTVSIPAVILVVVFVVETVAPGAILGPISEGFETVAPVVILAAVAGGAYLLREWLRARKQEASTPDTQVTLDLGDGGNGGS